MSIFNKKDEGTKPPPPAIPYQDTPAAAPEDIIVEALDDRSGTIVLTRIQNKHCVVIIRDKGRKPIAKICVNKDGNTFSVDLNNNLKSTIHFSNFDEYDTIKI